MKILFVVCFLVCISFASLSEARLPVEPRQNVDHQLTGHVSISGGTNINVGPHGVIASYFGRLFNFIFSIYKNIGSIFAKILTDSGVGSIKLFVGIRKFINRIVDFAFGLATGIINFVLKLNINIFKLVFGLIRGIMKGVYKILEAIPIIGHLFRINREIMDEFTNAVRKQLDGFANNEKSFLLNHKNFLLPRIRYIKKILLKLDELFGYLTEKPAILIRNKFWISLRQLFRQQIKCVDDAERFFETNGKTGSLGISF